MTPKQFLLRMDEADHKELKVFCASKGISMQDFVMKAIQEKRKQAV